MSSALDDDKVPYLLALLISAFTWHVGQISAELTQANTVAYDIKEHARTNDLVLSLVNISDDRYLQNNRFQFACPDGEPCIETASIQPRAAPPINIVADLDASFTDDRSADVFLTVSLPPGAEFTVALKRVAGEPFPQFLYAPLPATLPDAEGGGAAADHDGILLLPEGSARVVLMRNYVRIIGASFCLVFLLTIFIMGRWLWRTTKRQAASPLPMGEPDR